MGRSNAKPVAVMGSRADDSHDYRMAYPDVSPVDQEPYPGDRDIDANYVKQAQTPHGTGAAVSVWLQTTDIAAGLLSSARKYSSARHQPLPIHLARPRRR